MKVLVLLLAVVGCTATLHAQQPAQTKSGPRLLFLPTVHYGSPMRTAAGLGIFLPTAELPGLRRRGFIVEGGAGQGGARFSFGPASIVEYAEIVARGVLYRTWSSPLNASAHSTYGGAEAGIMIAYVRVSAGVAHRLAGPSGPHATILTWNAGLQFPF